MFKPQSKTFTLDGKSFTLKEFSAEEFFDLPENPFEVIALAWVGPGSLTKEEVATWPGSVVVRIGELITEMNDIAGNSLSGTSRTTE